MLAVRVYLDKRLGANGYAKVLSEMPPHLAEPVSGILLPVNWYPTDSYLAALHAAAGVLGPGFFEEFGEFAAEFEVTTFQRLMLRFASPAAFVEHARTAVAPLPRLGRVDGRVGGQGNPRNPARFRTRRRRLLPPARGMDPARRPHVGGALRGSPPGVPRARVCGVRVYRLVVGGLPRRIARLRLPITHMAASVATYGSICARQPRRAPGPARPSAARRARRTPRTRRRRRRPPAREDDRRERDEPAAAAHARTGTDAGRTRVRRRRARIWPRRA